MLDSRIGLMLPGWTINVLQGLEEMALRMFGTHFTHAFYRPMNEKIKKGEVVSQMDEHTYLITGHTHFAEIDHDARYVNSGFNKYGYISYVTVEDGDIKLHQKRYKE
jgi:predicted phosphodiesterase